MSRFSTRSLRESHDDGDLSEAIAFVEHAADAAFDDGRRVSIVPSLTSTIPNTSSVQLTKVKNPDVNSTETSEPSTQRVAPLSEKEVLGPRPKMWNASWLHHSVLTAFLGAFIAMFITVIILYCISANNDGLSTQIESRHYAWTYGPTARTSNLPTISLAS